MYIHVHVHVSMVRGTFPYPSVIGEGPPAGAFCYPDIRHKGVDRKRVRPQTVVSVAFA
jgi:hypothetical protein